MTRKFRIPLLGSLALALALAGCVARPVEEPMPVIAPPPTAAEALEAMLVRRAGRAIDTLELHDESAYLLLDSLRRFYDALPETGKSPDRAERVAWLFLTRDELADNGPLADACADFRDGRFGMYEFRIQNALLGLDSVAHASLRSNLRRRLLCHRLNWTVDAFANGVLDACPVDGGSGGSKRLSALRKQFPCIRKTLAALPDYQAHLKAVRPDLVRMLKAKVKADKARIAAVEKSKKGFLRHEREVLATHEVSLTVVEKLDAKPAR